VKSVYFVYMNRKLHVSLFLFKVRAKARNLKYQLKLTSYSYGPFTTVISYTKRQKWIKVDKNMVHSTHNSPKYGHFLSTSITVVM
jgi:hypothetical protein